MHSHLEPELLATFLDRATLDKLPISFATCSVGYAPEHTLSKKLHAIAAAGFTAIELAMPDLVAFAHAHLQEEVQSDDYERLCIAGKEVKKLCDAKGLQIILLQPFANFEGWPRGSSEREDAFARARGWIKIMQATGCPTLQVGSTDTPAEKLDSSRETIVADLRELASLLAEHDLRLAYENWCWSTHAPDWTHVWEIVKAVDRPNVGLCLDTFQSAGGEWADPTTASGMLETSGQTPGNVKRAFASSMKRLAETIPKDKIYLLQISDAYKPKSPFASTLDKDGSRPRASWSHDYRPIPYEGYLPVADVARAVLQTGFRGWFSYEVFDSGPDGQGKTYELEDFTKAAFASQKRLLDDCASS